MMPVRGASDYLRPDGHHMVALDVGQDGQGSLGKDDRLHKDKLMCAR
jgi:hypothetical protein